MPWVAEFFSGCWECQIPIIILLALLLSLNGRIKAMARAHGRGTELRKPMSVSLLLQTCKNSLAGSSLNFLETFMSLGTILLIVLIIILLGGFSGLGGGPFYGTGYYGGGGPASY